MSNVKKFAAAYSATDPTMNQFILEVDRQLDAIHAKIGGAASTTNVADAPPTQAAPPPQALFAVSGGNGVFSVTIVNPQNVTAASPQLRRTQIANGAVNTAGTPILHNVQSATGLDFSSASGIQDYGVSSQVSYSVALPSVARYWRVRSSYDGNTWNSWQVYGSTSGPVLVNAGS